MLKYNDQYEQKQEQQDKGQSSELKIANQWLHRQHKVRLLITLSCIFAAIGLSFLCIRSGIDGAFRIAVLIFVGMILVANMLLRLHDRRALRRLEEQHPELWDENAKYVEYSPINRIRGLNQAQKKQLGCGGTALLILGAIALFIGSSVLGFFAQARLTQMDKNAKAVYVTANTWFHQQKEAGVEITPQTVIVNFGEEYEKGSLEANMLETMKVESTYRRFNGKVYRTPDGVVKGGCAILCDENGTILYAFWSETPLTEADLVPVEYEIRYEQECSLWGDNAIGWYAP